MQAEKQFLIKRIPPSPYVFSQKMILGKGTFGEVYLGFDNKQKKPIAIKKIPIDKTNFSISSQQVFNQKLAYQVVCMQLANSQNLVKLVGVQKSTNNLYLACELCNGKSLKDYMDRKKYFSQSEALHIFKQILTGFYAMYEKKIVHRDLKPANILMHNYKIKIGDFGFSKAVDMHEQLLTSIVGSPLYMSPQILNNVTYTQKTDIWSLGIILYQMLFGEAPWIVSSVKDIKQKVKQKLDFPKHINISKNSKNLILKMLQYEQKNRVGWEELFTQFLEKHSNSSQMIEEQEQGLDKSITNFHEYFNTSLLLENQYHLIHILETYKRNFCEQTMQCLAAFNFFAFMAKQNQRNSILEPFFKVFTLPRNKVCYFMKMFVQIYDYIQDQKKSGEFAVILFCTLFLLLKMSISLLSETIQIQVRNMENFQIFANSSLFKNFKELFLYDCQILNNFYPIFMQKYFKPKMQEYKELNFTQQAQQNLNNFFSPEPTSSKYISFWLKNYSRLVFNHCKDLQIMDDSEHFISRMIYEYEKSDQTHLLELSGVETGTIRKIQNWRYDRKWSNKIKEAHRFQLESLGTFINKQIKWNPLNQYDLSFLKEK